MFRRVVVNGVGYDEITKAKTLVGISHYLKGTPEMQINPFYTGFCEGRVIQSELDAVNTHMMLENDVNPGILGIDEDSMNDCVEVGDTLNSKSNNSTIINDEFPNSNTEGNVTPKKHSIRGLMGWLAGLIY